MGYERTMALLSNRLEKTSPLSGRLAALLRESRLLLLVAVAIYLILILYGYDQIDPGWSHSASDAALHNPGGVFGAWLADVLLYVFGFSAWWWIARTFPHRVETAQHLD